MNFFKKLFKLKSETQSKKSTTTTTDDVPWITESRLETIKTWIRYE